MKTLVLLLTLAGVVALGLAGCRFDTTDKADTKEEPAQIAKAGQTCHVHFRRDALGVSSKYAIGPATVNADGREVALTGEYQRIDEDWLVIRVDTSNICIPREMILLVEVLDEDEEPDAPDS